jgi:hypothetical protein
MPQGLSGTHGSQGLSGKSGAAPINVDKQKQVESDCQQQAKCNNNVEPTPVQNPNLVKEEKQPLKEVEVIPQCKCVYMTHSCNSIKELETCRFRDILVQKVPVLACLYPTLYESKPIQLTTRLNDETKVESKFPESRGGVDSDLRWDAGKLSQIILWLIKLNQNTQGAEEKPIIVVALYDYYFRNLNFSKYTNTNQYLDKLEQFISNLKSYNKLLECIMKITNSDRIAATRIVDYWLGILLTKRSYGFP